MNKPQAVDPAIFEKVAELVGSHETMEDLWQIFDTIMEDFDFNYAEYTGTKIGYLFMVFAFGYCYGYDDMPQIQFFEDDPEDPTGGLH